MRPKKQNDFGQQDLFRNRLDQIIDLNRPLSRLTKLVDWDRLHKEFSSYYADNGRSGLPIRLMVGLNLLKHIYALSDEDVCARWVENPYFQYFCGEIFFQHRFPIERSSLSHFRGRIKASTLETILQESLAIACELGALKLKDVKSVAVDTTVQKRMLPIQQNTALCAKPLLS